MLRGGGGLLKEPSSRGWVGVGIRNIHGVSSCE